MSWGDIFFWPVASAFEAVTVIVGAIILIFVVFMMIDCYNRKFKVEAEKWIWIVLMLFTTWAAALLYYFFVKRLNPKGVAKK